MSVDLKIKKSGKVDFLAILMFLNITVWWLGRGNFKQRKIGRHQWNNSHRTTGIDSREKCRNQTDHQSHQTLMTLVSISRWDSLYRCTLWGRLPFGRDYQPRPRWTLWTPHKSLTKQKANGELRDNFWEFPSQKELQVIKAISYDLGLQHQNEYIATHRYGAGKLCRYY